MGWIGHSFNELFCAWAGRTEPDFGRIGSVLILALYREHPAISDIPAGSTRIRRFEVSNGVEGFNVPMPRQSTQLLESDLLTVIGRRAFGHIMERRGLLRGGANADNLCARLMRLRNWIAFLLITLPG